ncbi:MAG: hypothetical protein V4663_10440 [Bacteroidota bacterium]
MKNKFKYALALLVFFFTQVNAQQVDFYRAELEHDGRPAKYKNVNGSPYLFEDWTLGTAKTIDNATKKDIQLKYDEVEDILIMKGDNNKLLIFPVQVAEFNINDPKTNIARLFRSGFTATKTNTDKSFFEVIADGKVRLLRKNHKIISESKEYSGAINKSISDGIKYYLVNEDNTPVAVKLDIKSISALLPAKQVQLTEYAKTNKLNLKNHEDAVKLISYYNSL